MARAFPWLAAVLIFFFARVDFLFTNLTSRIWRDPQIRCRPQRRAVVSQTVMEDTETWRFFTRSLILWYVCRKWLWFVFFWSTLNTFEWLGTLKFYESGGSIDVHCFLFEIFPWYSGPQEVLPKSHLHGALQRVLGRDVYKSETPFFYRRDGWWCWWQMTIHLDSLLKDVSKKPWWWLASCERGWGGSSKLHI